MYTVKLVNTHFTTTLEKHCSYGQNNPRTTTTLAFSTSIDWQGIVINTLTTSVIFVAVTFSFHDRLNRFVNIDAADKGN